MAKAKTIAAAQPNGENAHLIRDRIRKLGYKHTRQAAWAVGQLARMRWQELNAGELPEKKLARKSFGKGVHCFAHYPRWFIVEIDTIVHRVCTARDRQGLLFQDE